MAEKKLFTEIGLEEGTTNTHKLYCPYPSCNSLILSPGNGILVRRPRTPGTINEKIKTEAEAESEVELEYELFWKLTDPFDFDNMGFSKPDGSGVKFLACADCDQGPLGYHVPPGSARVPKPASNGVLEPVEYLLNASQVLYYVK
ncbi:Mss4-like protein [Lipomyces japonicus]|uniref:Mss4-like protein n=1 Tax=Lipomyces japonicus TaxID=56871 RepID=UPI0034CF0DB3